MNRFARTCALFLFIAMLPACGGGDAKDKDAKPAPKDGEKKDAAAPVANVKLEPVTVGETKLQKFGRIYLGGQPKEADLAKFTEAGVKSVINLRGEGENKDFDEMKSCTAAGMTYNNPGFTSAATLTDPIIDRVRSLLTSEPKDPVLLHCASGNRVGAVWLAYRVLDENVPFDQALDEAKAIGLKSTDLEAKVRTYIEAQKK